MDCSKTIDFITMQRTICRSRSNCREGSDICPIDTFCKSSPNNYSVTVVERTIEAVQKWSNEHPKKTYAQDFFEKFPDAPKDKSFKEKCPWVCRMGIYGGKCPGTECDECWNEPMEE